MFSDIAERLTGKNLFPLDYFLTKKALEYNLELGGLETLEEQQEIAKNLNMDHQIRALKKVCKNPSSLKKQEEASIKYEYLKKIRHRGQIARKGR